MENQMQTIRSGPDVLDLDNSELVAGGGVGDFYCEDAASEYLSFTPWGRNIARQAPYPPSKTKQVSYHQNKTHDLLEPFQSTC